MNIHSTTSFLGNTSNQLEAANFKVSVVNYTQKVSEEWHYHEDIHLSSIIQGGNLESRKKEDIQVLPGKVMLYDQGEIHRNRFTAHPSKNLNIEFKEDFFTEEIRFSSFSFDPNTDLSFFNIYAELQLNDLISAESIAYTLKSLFWKEERGNHSSWVEKLKGVLHARWDEFPSLEELAKEIQVHPVTISRYFTKRTGMTLSTYMRKLKVKQATDFLINSSLPIVDIALRCGFSDQSHMNRLVKHHTGYTPGLIRTLN